MKNKNVDAYKKELDDLFAQITAAHFDSKLQSHWARYLCVRVSGFVETSVHALFSEYTRKRTSNEVAHYVTNQLKRLRNPNMNDIVALTMSFSTAWGQRLQTDTTAEQKEALDSIANLRNNIAHGGSASIYYTTVSDYYKSIVRVIEVLEDILQ